MAMIVCFTFFVISRRKPRLILTPYDDEQLERGVRSGYKVYDSDTHIEPSADTLEKYLSARVRELVPDLESRKADRNRTSPGFRPDMPYTRMLRAFRRPPGPVAA